MANVKISELPSLTTMTDAGEIPVVAGGATKQITGANLKTYFTANVGFTGDAIYDLNGVIIENADLSHGATASFIVPSNGNTTVPVQINNTYGNITLGTGPSSTITNTWTFDSDGNLTAPGLKVVGSIIALNPLSAATQVEISPNGESWAYIQVPNDATANAANVRIHNDAGNIEIAAGNSSGVGNVQYWYFDNAGTMTFPWGANITSVDSGNITFINSASGTPAHPTSLNLRAFGNTANMPPLVTTSLNSADARFEIHTYNVGTDTTYDWQFDDGGSFTLPNAPGNVYFGGLANQPVILPGFDAITLNANRADTTQDYITVSQNGIDIFSVNSINIENNTTGFTNSDINLRAGDDILLQGRDRPADEEREGGDLFIYGGNGSDASASGFDPGGGGDLLIEAGLGGAGTGTGANGGQGGQVGINAGNGGTTVDAVAGSGGSINITAGAAATPVDPASGGWGGDVTIRAGETTRVNENGGSITLWTGGGNGGGTGAAGYFEINIPSSNVGPGGTWSFSGTGTTFQVPADSEIYGASYGNFTVGCAGNTIVTSSDYGINPQNWVFGYTGTLTLPGLANISGGNFNAGTANANVALNAFNSDGNTVSIQAQGNTSSAVISIFANAGPVTNNWVFTHAALDPTEPYFYVPGGAAITTPNATGGGTGKNIFIEAGAADQSDFYTTAGGALMLKGGRGAFNDGGGGGPGGNVNINAGESADPAGVAGNVYITAGALRNWTFDNTGNLSLPLSGNIVGLTANNNGYLNWFGNSSGDGNGYTTLRLIPDDTRESADQYLIIDPTAPGHIHIRAGGPQDNSGADLILGGENSYFKVAAGANSVATIASNSNVWQFGTDGSLAVPGPMSLAVYANATVRDSSITSPLPGMMIYVTGTGMQVYGATQWNTIAGSGT